MLMSNLLFALTRLLITLYTYLTLPLYFLACRPWRRRSRARAARSRVVSRSAHSVTYRADPVQCPYRDELLAQPEQVDTLDKVFRFTVKKYGRRQALGTRALLREEQEQQPDGKVFKKLIQGDYKWLRYTDVHKQSDQAGRGLRRLGVEPRGKVCIFADTCAEWLVTAVGCFKNSIALVTIYTNLGSDGIVHGMQQTRVETAITSAELLPKLLKLLPQLPTIKNIVYFEHQLGTSPVIPPGVDITGCTLYPYSQLVELGKTSDITLAAPEPRDMAIIMYTSGSTGVPKGVIISHRNLVSALLSFLPLCSNALANEGGPISVNESYIAFLPLAHVLEMIAEHLMLLMGVKIGYSSPNTLTDRSSMVKAGQKGDAGVLRPTVMASVPLILDRIYKGILKNIALRGPFTQQLLHYCIQYRRKWIQHGYDTPIMNRIIFSKMTEIVGGRLRMLLSGGAPLAEDAHHFICTCLNLRLLQGYGLTETTALACVSDPDDQTAGHVGPPLQGVFLKIVDWDEGGYTINDPSGPRGEIVVGGHHVSQGYYNMPSKTEEDFFVEDGKQFFCTGDIGQVLPNGNVKVIDRKKDLVKLQLGEYVSLGKVEANLKIHPLVDNICVYGNSYKMAVVALVVPDEEKLLELAGKMGKSHLSFKVLCSDPTVVDAVLKTLFQHGHEVKLQKFEIPQQVTLLNEPWTPESGLVTAAFKLRRKQIQARFQQEINAMYDVMQSDQSKKVNVDKGKSVEIEMKQV